MIALRIAVVVALLYAGYTFYSRRAASQAVDQRIAEKAAEQAQEDVSHLGGSALKITSFYASPPVISPGHSAQLCYGVINADSLELSPPVEKVWPSLARCFEVTPRATRTYRLSAHGKGGVASNSLNITVQ